MRKLALLLLLIPAIAASKPKKEVPAAGAGKQSPPACGAKILPLVVGNTWTYDAVAAPTTLPEAMQRLAPAQPKHVVITVKSIDKKGADTVVSLEEKISYDISKDSKEPKLVDKVVASSITCNDKGKFDIAPESFFFAGEPGGVYGLTFDKFDRKKETSLKLVKGTIGDQEWIEEITSHFTRASAKTADAKLGGGKLDIERKFTPQPPEGVVTKLGSYRAEKLGLITSGRVTFDKVLSPEGKPCSQTKVDPKTNQETKINTESCELPANWISTLWLADNVGMVQSLNSYAHMYQLVEMTLK